jgi:Domain of unknown function (DUF6265)
MAASIVMRHAILAAMLAVGSAAVAGASSGVEQIAWLQGCWQSVSGDRVVEEQWTAPRAGSMLGTGRTVRGDTLVEYEFVVVRERGERLVYLAHPSGQPSAEFVSTTASPSEVVFENAQHDFPQRVGYQRQGTDLAAWIEGTRDGQTRRIDFHYRRAACPSN